MSRLLPASAALLIGLLCLLAGCGTKGPLYIPAPPAKPAPAPDVSKPAGTDARR